MVVLSNLANYFLGFYLLLEALSVETFFRVSLVSMSTTVKTKMAVPASSPFI